jgi:hypothetical protein
VALTKIFTDSFKIYACLSFEMKGHSLFINIFLNHNYHLILQFSVFWFEDY